LTAHEYSGNPNCESFGFDFGVKMEGCFEHLAGKLNNAGMTITDQKDDSCEVPELNLGSFELKCSAENEPVDATIHSGDNDMVVIMKGENGGTIYTGLAKGNSYTVDIGPKRKAISHIEFCFKVRLLVG